jgi:uncharacterized protein YecE (DUF72 family)
MNHAHYAYGTAGWSYKDWEGTVYPRPREPYFNPLLFLSRDFDFVEVNTTFYRIPSLKLTSGWIKKTEGIPHFSFWIKVYQQFTHIREWSKADTRIFLNSCQPLIEAERLSGFMAQFPYSFKSSQENIDYISNLRQQFDPHPFAVEFRHNSWNRPLILDHFSKNRIIWVNIDQPVISQSLPLTGHLTHPDISYFRLHGRNYGSWFSDKGRDARYDYSYSNSELNQIAEKIRKLEKLARTVFVSGNNHYKGQAVQNLKQLKQIMQGNQPGSE